VPASGATFTNTLNSVFSTSPDLTNLKRFHRSSIAQPLYLHVGDRFFRVSTNFTMPVRSRSTMHLFISLGFPKFSPFDKYVVSITSRDKYLSMKSPDLLADIRTVWLAYSLAEFPHPHVLRRQYPFTTFSMDAMDSILKDATIMHIDWPQNPHAIHIRWSPSMLPYRIFTSSCSRSPRISGL